MFLTKYDFAVVMSETAKPLRDAIFYGNTY